MGDLLARLADHWKAHGLDNDRPHDDTAPHAFGSLARSWTHGALCAMKVCACILLLLSVGSLRAQKPARTPAASSRDTSLIRVNGPTIIAFFPTSQAQLDSNPDEGEALADFQFYLGEIRTDFARADIQLVETYADTVRLAVLGRVVSFATRDSTPVGYYFVRPGRAPFIAYGVQSGLDLCAEAERYFRLRPRSLCR